MKTKEGKEVHNSLEEEEKELSLDEQLENFFKALVGKDGRKGLTALERVNSCENLLHLLSRDRLGRSENGKWFPGPRTIPRKQNRALRKRLRHVLANSKKGVRN